MQCQMSYMYSKTRVHYSLLESRGIFEYSKVRTTLAYSRCTWSARGASCPPDSTSGAAATAHARQSSSDLAEENREQDAGADRCALRGHTPRLPLLVPPRSLVVSKAPPLHHPGRWCCCCYSNGERSSIAMLGCDWSITSITDVEMDTLGDSHFQLTAVRFSCRDCRDHCEQCNRCNLARCGEQ